LYRQLVKIALVLLVSATASTARAANYDIPRLDGITIDGDVADWGDRGFRVGLFDRWVRLAMKPTLTDEADLRVGWDDKGLLLRVAREDAQHFEHEQHWRLDAIELFVFDQPGGKNGLQLVVTPGLDETLKELRWGTYLDMRPPGSPKATLEAVRTVVPGGYVMEIRIPWSNLNIEPAVGRSIGAQMVIVDADASRDRADVEFICWYPDKATASDSSKVHRLTLADAPSAPEMAQVELVPDGPMRVRTPDRLAGKTLTIEQDGRTLGTVELAGSPIAAAEVALKELDLNGPPATLRAADEVLSVVTFYRPLPAAQRAVLSQAMNTADEKERYRLLRFLQADVQSDPRLQADLDNLMTVVDAWANNYDHAMAGRLAVPGTYLNAIAAPGSPEEVRADSPVYPIFCLYRGRHLAWWVVEYGRGFSRASRQAILTEAHRLFEVAHKAAPGNPIIGIYLRKPMPTPPPFAPDAAAPEWANEQRVATEGLADIIHWWIDHRQLPDGSFGGEWGDDVEMWREWAPILIAFDDPKIKDAQERLSASLFRQPHMAGGYTADVTDVEHTSEDSADTITPMLHLAPNDPDWRARAERLAELTRDLWTGINERGHRQFKSVVFSGASVSDRDVDAFDTVYHPRVVQPALLLWQRNRNAAMTELFTSWLDNWVAAAAREDAGKPAGIVPSAIHWPSGDVRGIDGQWWRPGAYRDSILYQWPSSLRLVLSTLLLGYDITGEPRYLEPILSMAKMRQAHVAAGLGDNPADHEPGSLAWCAAQLNAPLLDDGTLAKYRMLTGDKQFDDLLLKEADGYVRYRLTGDDAAVTAALRGTANAMRVDRPAYTSEVRWTDRVFVFHNRYYKESGERDMTAADTRMLYGSLTGDPGSPLYFPMNAVRWKTVPREFAALVDHTADRAFTARLYHFGQTPRAMSAELYGLAPGEYQVTLTAQGAELASSTVSVETSSTIVSLQVPPRVVCVLTVKAK
jgi:hypothetical protein